MSSARMSLARIVDPAACRAAAAVLLGLAWTGAALAQAAVPAAAAASAPAWTGAPIAGLQPDRRPATAPRLTAQPVPPAVLAQRLKGIEGKPPPNVQAQAEQPSAWFTPSFGPGMTPPYDPRGWHAGRPRDVVARPKP